MKAKNVYFHKSHKDSDDILNYKKHLHFLEAQRNWLNNSLTEEEKNNDDIRKRFDKLNNKIGKFRALIDAYETCMKKE